MKYTFIYIPCKKFFQLYFKKKCIKRAVKNESYELNLSLFVSVEVYTRFSPSFILWFTSQPHEMRRF
jgi:hypothetical protein